MCLNYRVVRGKDLKLVGSGLECGSCHLRHFLSNTFSKTNKCVKTRANCCAALGQLSQVRKDELDAFQVAVKLRNIAAELLTQRQRRGILQMCPPNLDDVFKFFRFRSQRISEARQGRYQVALNLQN